MEQTSFTYDRELEVNGGSNTDWTLAQSPVSSFDQDVFVWCGRTLRGEVTGHEGQRPVDSSKVPKRENHDRTCPVSADQTLSSKVTGRWGSRVRSTSVRFQRGKIVTERVQSQLKH